MATEAAGHEALASNGAAFGALLSTLQRYRMSDAVVEQVIGVWRNLARSPGPREECCIGVVLELSDTLRALRALVSQELFSATKNSSSLLCLRSVCTRIRTAWLSRCGPG